MQLWIWFLLSTPYENSWVTAIVFLGVLGLLAHAFLCSADELNEIWLSGNWNSISEDFKRVACPPLAPQKNDNPSRRKTQSKHKCIRKPEIHTAQHPDVYILCIDVRTRRVDAFHFLSNHSATETFLVEDFWNKMTDNKIFNSSK